MNELTEYRARASAILVQLGGHLSVHANDLDQLREAGVAPHRIRALYPFEVDEWKKACSKIAFSTEYHTADARMLTPSLNLLTSVARCLEPSEPAVAKVNDALESADDHSARTPSALMQRMLLTGLLLHAISQAQAEAQGYDMIIYTRLAAFFSAVLTFNDALKLTPETTIPWAVNS